MHPLELHLESDWPTERWRDLPVLIAVSGGADSVALLRAMLKLAGPARIAIGHFNHRLRGDESDADEQFVRDLAASWNLPIEVGQAPSSASEESAEVAEAEARRWRYKFLQAASERQGARYLVTAHTADDQVETVLHRIVRGTGIAGLAGIPRLRQLSEATTLIRPLLGVRRSEVLSYLESLGQPFRTDSSNLTSDFTRNRVRHELLPRLAQEFNPRVAEAILRLSQQAGEVQSAIEAGAQSLAKLAVGRELVSSLDAPFRQEWLIDCRPLANQPRHLVREMLLRLWREAGWPEQRMTFQHWERLASLCEPVSPAGNRGDSPQQDFPGGIVAQRQNDTLCLRQSGEATSAEREASE